MQPVLMITWLCNALWTSRGGAVQFLVVSLMVATTMAGAVDVSKLPPSATRVIDFKKDIQPLLESRCVTCHGAEKQKSGYRLDSKNVALKGGETYSPAIKPGDSADSPLIHLVAGLVPDMKMPAKGDPLTPEQVGVLRAWIDQGARWPEESRAEVERPNAI